MRRAHSTSTVPSMFYQEDDGRASHDRVDMMAQATFYSSQLYCDSRRAALVHSLSRVILGCFVLSPICLSTVPTSTLHVVTTKGVLEPRVHMTMDAYALKPSNKPHGGNHGGMMAMMPCVIRTRN